MDLLLVVLFFLAGLFITFMWLQIAQRAALALDRFSRTRDNEVVEQFLRKNIGISDEDFQSFLKKWKPEDGFEPGEVYNAFLRWKLAVTYKELHLETTSVLPDGSLDLEVSELSGLSVEDLQEIIDNPAEHTQEIVEAAHRLLAERSESQ